MPAKTQAAALAEFSSLPDESFVPISVVMALFDKGESTVHRNIKSGLLPKPVKFGHASRWNVGSLRAFIAKKVEAQ
ncbi:helix-turn-helix transcriptional regulator [Ralstonia chuxiongensis]|uniref:helix-turn-helix transcriptional regulator n=1 Tax=Ralstonia chuxiongensis TaxID=2957504 RepID=UPI0028F5CABD|nr:transcriptional regulator [Ralstonia chuxiongensis]CAJ0777782.1 hypothetical protein R8510_04409 [Ralstonia chuxiongensis]